MSDDPRSRPSIVHWALLIGVAAAVGGGAGWLGSRAGAPQSAPAPSAPAVQAPIPAETAARAATTTAATRSAAPTLPPAGSLRKIAGPRAGGPAPLPATLPSITADIAGESNDARITLAERMVRSNDPAEKWDAINVLAGTDDPRAWDIARRVVREKDIDIATGAAHVLSQGPGLGDEDVTALEQMMKNTEVPGGERAGYNAVVMAAMRDGKAPGDLAAWAHKALAADAPEIRGSVVANVAPLPSEQAVPLLIEALGDSDELVAEGARNALVFAHGGDQAFGKDAAAWEDWWEKKRTGALEPQVPAVAPLPEGFVRPENDPPPMEAAPTPSYDAPEAP